MATKMRTFSREEVSKHNRRDDLWVIIEDSVYDLTHFAEEHPGGLPVIMDPEIAGQDATAAFYGLHRHEVLSKPEYQLLRIGVVEGVEAIKILGGRGPQLSRVPHAEPTWLAEGYHSPYYNQSHRDFQMAMRLLFSEVVMPDALVKEETGGQPSQEVMDKLMDCNLPAMRLGPGKHLQGRKLMYGIVKPEEYDYFHELILNQELARSVMRGYGDAILSGLVIGLPPVINFGNEQLKARVVPEALSGKKTICLAISEAQAGSDVSGLHTTAVKTPDGEHWIINGSKKWITNGVYADYFTVGCKTEDGLTVILVERSPGLETRPIKTSYSSSPGTAFVTFDNVKVPVSNTLGGEGNGIFVILSNFNHERWVMCCCSARSQMLVVEECLKWMNQRIVEGDDPTQGALRSRVAAMIARAETTQNWLENITHQMCNMSYKEQAKKLAGPISLLKSYATQAAQDSAKDAMQIFGSHGLQKTGVGLFVEHYYRTVPFDALLGGAEDVLSDLGVRQALRAMPKNTRL
ncbi:acyl-CoA dehydrogenase [Coprinopsis marcescibilis]|uniref:Acyl-CoA dehydrogenase n=1 Tax=Coprinopsis marcescibilis TaxID=230819 RepID=A0A5C3L2Z5_COPMA|nr:acyl-CoA dehydrogenase [Coprinopsis marcescibilis]